MGRPAYGSGLRAQGLGRKCRIEDSGDVVTFSRLEIRVRSLGLRVGLGTGSEFRRWLLWITNLLWLVSIKGLYLALRLYNGHD